MWLLRDFLVVAIFSFFCSTVFAQDAPPEMHVVKLENLEWKLLDERIEAHLVAFQFWVDAACTLSGEQMRALSNACHETHARAKVRFTAPVDPGKTVEFELTEYQSTPIIFTGADDVASSLFDQQFKEAIHAILTPSQLECFQVNQNQRLDSFHESSVVRIYDMIDEMMFLVPSQRDAVRQRISDTTPPLTSGLYTYKSNYRSLKSKLITEQAWYPKDLFTPSQLARSKTRSKESGFLIFASDFGVSFFQFDATRPNEEFVEFVESKLDVARKMFDDQTIVVVDAYRDQLDQKCLDHFLMATRGAKERILDDWYRGQVGQLFGELPEGFVREHYYVIMPNYSSLDFEQVWSTELSGGKLKELQDQQSEVRNDNLKSYYSMIFNQELWLTESQKKEFDSYLYSQVDFIGIETRDYRSSIDFRAELLTFARLLHSISDERMEQLLSTQQLEVWKLLKKNITVRENEIWYPQLQEAFPLGSLWKLPYYVQ